MQEPGHTEAFRIINLNSAVTDTNRAECSHLPSFSRTYFCSQTTKSTEKDTGLGHSMHRTVTQDISLTAAREWEGSHAYGGEGGWGRGML